LSPREFFDPYFTSLQEKVLVIDKFMIERHLLKIAGNYGVSRKENECSVIVDVGVDGGSWIIKFRRNSVLVNNW
jgi:hypothetical protein